MSQVSLTVRVAFATPVDGHLKLLDSPYWYPDCGQNWLKTRLANVKTGKRSDNYATAWNDDGKREDGTRLLWASDTNKLPPGIRWVGYAHELRRMDHTGWYCDPHGDGQLCRGGVVQLPGRDGVTRYLPCYVTGDDMRRGFMVESVCIPLDWSDVEETKPYEDGRESKALREAAYAADCMAERYAEDEREYREKEEAEQRAADLRDKATGLKTEANVLRIGIREKLLGLFAIREWECNVSHRETAGEIIRDAILADIASIRRLNKAADKATEEADDIVA